ncbi:hypothetical protein [Micromonospora sp. NPDC005174]|uniref:hypothetical protein n=1 Tax=Micromonospora sp. NPDC005174 TaxID=3157018 RepID=UPI0033BE7605
MRWWRWLRAFLSNQVTSASLLFEAESERDRLAALLRRERACRELEADMHRADVAALRREAESLHAANEERHDAIQRERAWSNTMAHRLRKGHEFADRLPDDLAADLRAALSPTFPTQPEEASRAR